MALLTHRTTAKKTTGKTVFRNTTRCLKLTEDRSALLDEVATAKGVTPERMDARRDPARAAPRT